MSKFVLFWSDGKREITEGKDISDAMTNRGYGAGALKSLDFYSTEISVDDYEWNPKNCSWQWTEKKKQKEIKGINWE